MHTLVSDYLCYNFDFYKKNQTVEYINISKVRLNVVVRNENLGTGSWIK